MIRVAESHDASAEIAWRAYDLLSEEQGLRTTTADIEISAQDNTVFLKGRVRTNILYDLADRLARQSTEGVQVYNSLINDEQLAVDIASRVGRNPRSARANVRFDVFLGAVTVNGSVHNADERAAVLELAAATPGVVRVEDHITLLR
jgi:osmotically-inducible protein OsmY